MSEILNAAEDYVLAGFSVLPCQDDKKPAISKWKHLQSTPLSLNQLESEFTNIRNIGVICGNISEQLEAIDFDSHGNEIDSIYNTWRESNKVIFDKYNFYIERSKRGGIHVIYRVNTDEILQGNVQSRWDNSETMIETRGEGQYVIVAPSPGYTIISNSLTEIPTIQPNERDQLLSTAKSLTRFKLNEIKNESDIKAHHYVDPVSWFNWNKTDYAKQLLMDEGWTKTGEKEGIEYWLRPGKTEGTSATWGKKENYLYVFTNSDKVFKNNCYYCPFQILVLLKFYGNFNSAINWILIRYFENEHDYLRIGPDYFKKIVMRDRFGIKGIEIKRWKKEEIKDDFGKKYFSKIPKFDSFCIVPDNFNYQSVIDNCYNLYFAFRHKEKQGTFKWSEILMRHVFGDQLDLGYRYMQCLYLHPDKMLPILVLVSKERSTGKTTFLNWLNMIFGGNCVLINPSELTESFNAAYAAANIIEVEETTIETSMTVEKVKALATGKFIQVNDKFISKYKLPFFGKIVMASNNEDKFAKVDEEEIRFFVRKLNHPTFKNHQIEEDLMKEIPAFLYHLSHLPAVDFSVGRVPFTIDELKNETLSAVKQESKTWLYKDMYERFVDIINNSTIDSEGIEFIPKDIKDNFYTHNSKIDIPFIKKTLKDEFRLHPGKNRKYRLFGDKTASLRTGTAYRLTVDFFNKNEIEEVESVDFPF